MKTFDSSDMALRGRIGGYSKASRYPANELTCAARAGFISRFIPDDPAISPEEKNRRAKCALRAHMLKLARLSALSRQKNKPKDRNEYGNKQYSISG